MAKESSAFSGSGLSVLREQQGLRYIGGSNVVLVNPEDESKLGIVQSSGLLVGTDAVHLTGPAERLRGRREVTIQNLGADPVYIGSSSVTTDTGLRIGSGEIFTLDVLDFGDIFIVGDGSSDVRILEVK